MLVWNFGAAEQGAVNAVSLERSVVLIWLITWQEEKKKTQTKTNRLLFVVVDVKLDSYWTNGVSCHDLSWLSVLSQVLELAAGK